MLLMVIGSLLAGGLADQVGASMLLNGGAGIYVIAGVLAAVLLAKPARQAVAAAGNVRRGSLYHQRCHSQRDRGRSFRSGLCCFDGIQDMLSGA